MVRQLLPFPFSESPFPCWYILHARIQTDPITILGLEYRSTNAEVPCSQPTRSSLMLDGIGSVSELSGHAQVFKVPAIPRVPLSEPALDLKSIDYLPPKVLPFFNNTLFRLHHEVLFLYPPGRCCWPRPQYPC